MSGNVRVRECQNVRVRLSNFNLPGYLSFWQIANVRVTNVRVRLSNFNLPGHLSFWQIEI
jgi:hypothetical protein